MENPRIKKGLGVTVVLLFLSITCLPIVNASEGKPDLIIENITIEPGTQIYTEECYCKIKNIGDSPAGDEIEVRIIVKRKPLGIFPALFTVYSDT
ncbi:MAG: hypothetical protein MUO73_00825, partial [Thermoplasmata archaeon]|nr:hypothetical protein [Thermoplasmata archaeon]